MLRAREEGSACGTPRRRRRRSAAWADGQAKGACRPVFPYRQGLRNSKTATRTVARNSWIS